MFRKVLDGGSKWVINRIIKEFGKMLKFEVDSKNKIIYALLELKGENEPVEIKISGYEIVKENEEYYFTMSDISVSKEWMEILAKEYLHKKIKVPLKLIPFIKVLL